MWLPAGSDSVVLGTVLAALTLLYLPTWWDLTQTIWRSDDQSQGPLILITSLAMFAHRRNVLAALPARPSRFGWPLLGIGLVLYAVGRSQSIWLFEVGSQIAVIAAALLLFKGPAALRMAWFPLFFLLFMVPLPGPLVAALTGPLKTAASAVAAELLYQFGYPVSRTGVILTVGPYLILVADACAGLTSMFSLEALSLLYLHVAGHTSPWRNGIIAALAVPISFCANVVRVVILVLVTYHLGDEAGRGFLHGFAGLVLFVVALALVLVVDAILGVFFRARRAA
jgi:exosortase B